MRGGRLLGALILLAAALTPSVLSQAESTAATSSAATTSVAATAFQQNAAHTGHVDDPLFTLPLRRAWSHTFTGSAWYPLLVGGRVYVDVTDDDITSNSPGPTPKGTSVYAFDLTTGAFLWGPVELGGDRIWGSLGYDRGRLLASNGSGEIFALDPTSGAVEWTTDVPGTNDVCWAPLAAAAGSMYLACGGQGSTVYAFNDVTGAVRWSSDNRADISGPTIAGRDVIVHYACPDTYDYAPNGNLRWHHSDNNGCYGAGQATAAIVGGLAYLHNNYVPSRIVHRSTGKTIAAFSPPAIVTPPAINGSMMFDSLLNEVCRTNCPPPWALRGQDATSGKVRWTNTSKRWEMAPVSVNDDVVSAAPDGTVAVFDGHTGARLWSRNAGDPITPTEDGNCEDLITMAEANGYLAVPTQHTITVFASSPKTDKTAPTVAESWRSRVVRSRTATLTWSGQDHGSGIGSFDVRYRIARTGRTFGHYRYPVADQHTTAHSLVLHLAAGKTVCASVRGRDRAGNTSGWTPPRCARRPRSTPAS